MAATLQFDDTTPEGGKKLVRSAYDEAKDKQFKRNEQYRRNNNLYHGVLNTFAADPDRANVHWPKTFQIVETIVPRHIKAMHGTRPYLPFDARRKEFKELAENMVDIIDDLLDKAGYLDKRILQKKIAVAHGTSFIEATPYLDMINEKVMAMQMSPMGPMPAIDQSGMPVLQDRKVPRLRLRLQVYAPWEVYLDPFWTGLEAKHECRYAIKVQIVSKREVERLAMNGTYPSVDFERLKDWNGNRELTDHFGFELMRDLGLATPEADGDMGVLLRYESPDRYIDMWDGEMVLRDIPNPYKHGLINLSRSTYITPPSTQNCGWGIGAIKPVEILQYLLNDTWNMTLDAHMSMNHPSIAFRGDAIHPDAIVKSPGARWELKSTYTGSVRDAIQEFPGVSLPKEHYTIPEATESYMEKTDGVTDFQFGTAPDTSRTATSDMALREAGDVRLELDIVQDERCQRDFLYKLSQTIDQSITLDDKIEILGEEKAMQTLIVSPMDLPGGHNITFRGSDQIVNQAIRQRNANEMAEFFLQDQFVKPLQYRRWLMGLNQVKTADIDEILMSEEELQQMQMQAQQQQQMEAEQERAQQDQKAQQDQANAEAEHGRNMQMQQMKGQQQLAAHNPMEQAAYDRQAYQQ